MIEVLQDTIGQKQKEAIIALKRGQFTNYTFIEYFNNLKREFDEILKKLLPKAGKEKMPNVDYEPFKLVDECQSLIQKILKKLEYTGQPRLDEIAIISDWIETYKNTPKLQNKFELKEYLKQQRSKRTKANQPETFIEENIDNLIKKITESILQVIVSLKKNMEQNELNPDIIQDIICTSRKAGHVLEYLKIIDAIQTIAEANRQACIENIIEAIKKQREESEDSKPEDELDYPDNYTADRESKHGDDNNSFLEDIGAFEEIDMEPIAERDLSILDD